MTTNHTTSCAIKHGVNTQGFFSYEDPKNLIVFVHGFGGNATGTWNNFLSMILFDDHFKESDIVFYGYNTFKGQAGDHAAQLYDFLNLMQAPLGTGILPPEQGLPERNYHSILLVAHSLGAVLARQAQLLAFIAERPWVQQSSLALFAPAHNGAGVINLAMQALPGLSSLLGLFAKFQYPILNDLSNAENGILTAIREHTSNLQDKGVGNFSKARLVVCAMGDNVVGNYQYLDDSPAKTIERSSHTKVCKPHQEYTAPVEYIKSILNQQ